MNDTMLFFDMNSTVDQGTLSCGDIGPWIQIFKATKTITQCGEHEGSMAY
jgi:hypothetical protein